MEAHNYSIHLLAAMYNVDTRTFRVEIGPIWDLLLGSHHVRKRIYYPKDFAIISDYLGEPIYSYEEAKKRIKVKRRKPNV